jgi:DamX protein
MVENDTFSYQLKNAWLPDYKDVDALAHHERTRNLELITHLMANSTQALIVCGLDAIDKTHFLNQLIATQQGAYLICQLQSRNSLTLVDIQAKTVEQLNPSKKKIKKNLLSADLSLLERGHKNILLIIDEAGQLTAGVMDELINYAAQHSFLKLIFVLTHDDLDLKNDTEVALPDCHVIEIIDTLDQNTLEEVKWPETQPSSRLNSTDQLTKNLYLDSQFIRGGMISMLPAQEGALKANHAFKILMVAVISLITLALAVQWYSATNDPIASKASTDASSLQPTPLKAE